VPIDGIRIAKSDAEWMKYTADAVMADLLYMLPVRTLQLG
jgi:hypothetical protein